MYMYLCQMRCSTLTHTLTLSCIDMLYMRNVQEREPYCIVKLDFFVMGACVLFCLCLHAHEESPYLIWVKFLM